MKRKIIVLISSLFLVVPFITPVYADDVTTYWDGSYFGTNPALNPLGQEVSYGGKRWRSNYKPDATTILFRQGTNNNELAYSMLWYVGEYNALSQGTSDSNMFKEQLLVYADTVANNASVYTTTVIKGTNTSYIGVQSFQVGTKYRVFVQFTNYVSVPKTSPITSFYTGNASNSRYLNTNNTGNNIVTMYAFKQLLGYDSAGANNVVITDLAKNETYLGTIDANRGFFADGVITAFEDGNVIAPSNGVGAGSNGNNSTGVGNGVPNGSGQVGSSTITFEGSDNQVQNQSQNQNQTIESNAVNVTVNNEISGGSGGGSGESDVDRINALDNLLTNQSVGTSFNEAIQNVNNFRQLGVAFADTATVFLGWLPSWVLALLGLMFTLLFFFIILRLLKVFHG